METIIEDFFIKPGVDLGKDDEELPKAINLSKQQLRERWNTPKGREIFQAWKASNFDRAVLDRLVGKYYHHTDIRGIYLTGERLENVDLSNVDLFGANLEKTNLSKTDLRNSWISESNIKGAKFDWAAMDQALLDNVEFSNKTSFVGVNLNAVNFTLAALLQDLAITQQRIANLESMQPKLALFLKVTCDYGRSFTRFFFWSAGTILTFGLIYFFIPKVISKNGFLESIYFSFVTFTTLGFGDITPSSPLGMLLVILEVVIGYIMLGLLVAIISRRVIGG